MQQSVVVLRAVPHVYHFVRADDPAHPAVACDLQRYLNRFVAVAFGFVRAIRDRQAAPRDYDIGGKLDIESGFAWRDALRLDRLAFPKTQLEYTQRSITDTCELQRRRLARPRSCSARAYRPLCSWVNEQRISPVPPSCSQPEIPRID